MRQYGRSGAQQLAEMFSRTELLLDASGETLRPWQLGTLDLSRSWSEVKACEACESM